MGARIGEVDDHIVMYVLVLGFYVLKIRSLFVRWKERLVFLQILATVALRGMPCRLRMLVCHVWDLD